MLDFRRGLFTHRVVEHWNRLPREVVMAPRLPVHKPLDSALRHTNGGVLGAPCAEPGVGTR